MDTKQENRLQIVGIGMAALDVVLHVNEMPAWNQRAQLKDVALLGGGPVGSALAAASRLGANVGYLGVAGSDYAGEIKMRSLQEYGVDVSRVSQRDEPETQVVLVHVDAETGERMFSTPERWGSSLLAVDELDKDYITSADFLHLDGCHYEAAMQATQWMHEAGKKVMLDGHTTNRPVSDQMRSLVEQVDIVISGSGFARHLTGIENIWEAGAAILDMGPSVFVQTEGEQGSYSITTDERFHTPRFKVDVVDTTGAGDVFHGAYMVGLLQAWPLQQITQFATAVSALKCTKLGGRAGIPYFEEVISFLRERGNTFFIESS